MKFISYKKWINEVFPKNKWETPDKEEYSDDLISLVQTAYKNTPKGSFINTKKDVMEPDWLAIDFDDDPDLDATIFYRKPRKNETWSGIKIQGIGHDGSRKGIIIVLNKLRELLNKPGVWTEASDAVEQILYQVKVPYVDEKKVIQQIFPNTNLRFIGDRGKYIRNIDKENIVKETIFGKPKVSVNEKFTEDSDPIQDMGIGLKRDFTSINKMHKYIFKNILKILNTKKIPQDILNQNGWYIRDKYDRKIYEYTYNYLTVNKQKINYIPEDLFILLIQKYSLLI
jgi:hypothetical protein